MVAATLQPTRYIWLLAGACTALILLAGRLVLPNATDAFESLFRDWVLSGAPYARPVWATLLEAMAAIGVVAFAGAVLPRLNRKAALLATLGVTWCLLILSTGLLSWAGTWAKLLLPVLATLGGFAATLIFSGPDRAPTVRTLSSGRKFTNVAPDQLLTLAENLKKQGQLELAFETYQRCPLTAEVRVALQELILAFERRQQQPKAQAVREYLARYDRRKRAPATPPESVAAKPRPATVTPIDRPDPSKARPTAASASKETLGRYEIERELGQGAMGTVYLGRDPKINRVVAIKAISLAQEFEDADLEEAKARFFREAEMAGRLNHPNIVTVYDAGEDQGLAFIAMEYLKGRHLSFFADSQRLLPTPAVLEIIARLADALHYAHRQNVVHRDIKPANIMYDSETDELKITDFGIARLTDTSRTKTGIVLGTPSFMSPEQLEGRSLDGRSDLFALGVSLYHLLAGQLPFRAGSMTQLMHKIASEPHPPIRTVRPELPPCVDTILDRTLAKSPDDRFQTGAELAAALRACAHQMAAV